jgi:hypothetical protein
MSGYYSRRNFISKVSMAGTGLYLGLADYFPDTGSYFSFASEVLFDWSDWERYRHLIKHPCLTVRESDLAVARENTRKYGWAGDYCARVESKAGRYLDMMTPSFLERMIGETTPGDPLWTPCPACRDQGKPLHPHGLWTWKVDNPDQLVCDVCGTVFPNVKYPEEIVIRTRWGKPQDLTYCGGDTFVVFGYRNARPGFSANIRSRKVQWMANYCHTLAEAWALTGKIRYAGTCRDILLRFAACYPNWLVHVGYGEYADMDPRKASEFINKLPEPEICPPPNIPDNSLWTGYWSAGRASGVGLESDFIRKVVSAYDLTCSAKNGSGADVYTGENKKKIERDLLLESTILLVCDKSINNKSVSNRTAVALVGMCTGHPGLVRFGLDGFRRTVDGWYLPDGTTSESPFYGLMTLGGIWDMAQAARGYSDPPGYRDINGARIDSLDLYHGTSYKNVLEAFFRGMQGDLFYPPTADSFRSTRLDIAYVELMVANYPEKSDYLALLKELCGKDLSLHSGSDSHVNRNSTDGQDDEPVLVLPYDLTRPAGFPSFSFYYRKPGLESGYSQSLKLTDWCPPEMRIGHLRTGIDGRESLLLMNASHWGNHHEYDSLNIYYWKSGREILSDPGYLWDHPLKMQNMRTVAHNTVVLDEKNQAAKERGGKVLVFETSDHVKVMEMTSDAYPGAKLYRRTSAIIDHGNGNNYVVDFFRVEGGKIQDYIFHGAESTCRTEDIDLRPLSSAKLYDFSNIRTAGGNSIWRAGWKSGQFMNCVAWSAGLEGETVFVAEGWGQRDWKNSDIGVTIPYFVRRHEGEGEKLFITVFEGYQGNEPFVRRVSRSGNKNILKVETREGTDYIMSASGTGMFRLGKGRNGKILEGHFAAGSVKNNKILWNFVCRNGR